MQNLNQLFIDIFSHVHINFILHLTNQATSIKKIKFKKKPGLFKVSQLVFESFNNSIYLTTYLCIVPLSRNKIVFTLNFYCSLREIKYYNFFYSVDHLHGLSLKFNLLLVFNFKIVFTYLARNISLCIIICLSVFVFFILFLWSNFTFFKTYT